MGFDYERGKFTAEPHSMLPVQVARLVFELEPGDSAVVRDESVWVDRSPDRSIFIDGNTDALTDNQVIAIGNSNPEDYSRVHRVKKGIVLDRSHLNIRGWNWTNGIYIRRAFVEDPEVFPMPIIHPVFNEDELEIIKPALKKCGIKLKKLVTVTELMEAIDEAVEIEEDDSTLEETDGSSGED
jgi:hypothetical protein